LALPTFTTTNGIKIRIGVTSYADCGDTEPSSTTVKAKLNGSTIASVDVGDSTNGGYGSPDANHSSDIEFYIRNNASLSVQEIITRQIMVRTDVNISTAYFGTRVFNSGTASTGALDTSSAQTLTITFTATGGKYGSASVTNKSIIVEAISL
jgi:hypothetical protein